MTQTVVQYVSVRLEDELVGELPRFFGGRLAAFKELFQNAYRAGATRVDVRVEDGVVTFADDGRGCPNPQKLFSAGKSGWNKNKVIAPAGLGFFSILNPDLVHHVEVSSNDWTMTLEPTHVLKKSQLAVYAVPSLEPGFRATLNLQKTDGDDPIVADVQRARGLYPFQVTCNDEEVAPEDWKSMLELDTSVGRLEVRLEQWGGRHRESVAVWEHRRIEGRTFWEVMAEVAEKDRLWKRMLRDFLMRWHIEPTSGVRPKLPDRNDLNRDSALFDAAHVILTDLHAMLLEEAREVSRAWPENFESAPSGPHWLTSTTYGHRIIEELGWRCINWVDHSRSHGHRNVEEGLTFDVGCGGHFSRKFITVEDAGVAHSINAAKDLGVDLPFAVAEPGGAAVEIHGRVDPSRPESLGLISLAKRISVAGFDVPFLMDAWDAAEGTGGAMVLACDADEATAVVTGKSTLSGMNGQRFFNFVVMYTVICKEVDLWSLDWDQFDIDDDYDTEPTERALLEQVSLDFVGGERAEARLRLHVLKDERDVVCQVASSLEHRLQERPELLEARATVAKLLEAVDADLDETRSKAALSPAPTS